MKLGSLRLKNFFSHEDSTIDFNDIASITMILGAKDGNQGKSNGAGKTTILEAILYALFEETRLTANKNATLDDMVRWSSNGLMSVEFQFELNGNNYKITRTRDKNKQKGTVVFEVQAGEKWKPLTDAKKGSTNKEILKLIGIDYDTFCASICFQQKEVDKFVSATESERKSIIKNILQLDRYDNYRDSAKAKLQVIDTTLKTIDQQLLSSNVNILDLEIKEKSLVEIDQKLNVYRIQKETIESQLEKLRRQQILFNQQSERMASLNKQLSDRRATISKLLTYNTAAQSKQEEYQKIYVLKKEECKKLDNKFDEIKDSFTIEKQEILRDGKSADARLRNSESRLEALTEQYHKLSGELEQIDKNIEEVSKLHTNAHCPTCFSGITKESKTSSVNFLVAHKALIKTSHTIAHSEYELGKKTLEEDKKQLEIVKERLQEFSRWAKEKLHLQDTIKLFKEAISESKTIVEGHKNTIKDNVSIVEQYSQDVVVLDAQVKEITFDSSGFDLLNKNISKHNDLLSDCLRLTADNQIQKGRLLFEIQNIKDSLERIKLFKTDRDHQLKEKFYYTELVKMFGKEIPTLIIENACLELSDEANKILNVISEDALEFVTQRENQDGTKREVFEIEITRPTVPHPILIDSLSNGQKFRVVFAIRIALSRLLVRRRNSSSMEFLFYDECFSSLDDEGIEDVINVFRYLKEEFKHQLIITHGTNLKDRFDSNVILVNQVQGISTIKVQ